jgi:hypothetical protein
MAARKPPVSNLWSFATQNFKLKIGMEADFEQVHTGGFSKKTKHTRNGVAPCALTVANAQLANNNIAHCSFLIFHSFLVTVSCIS